MVRYFGIPHSKEDCVCSIFASTSLDEKNLGSGEWQQLGTWSHDMAHGDDKTKQSIDLIWPVELKCGKGATLVKDVNKIMRTMGCSHVMV